MRQILLWASPLLITSCSTYRSYFDCPAHPGAGCQAVSQIEEQIIEYQDGEDCFCGSCFRHQAPLPSNETIHLPNFKQEPALQRVWICPRENSKGHLVEGHYVYFSLEEEEHIAPINEQAP